MKNNSLNWYNFRENASILEVEAEQDLSKINEKYDYVIFYDLEEVLEVKKLLKENGTAILLVDNKFGISYFAGGKPKSGKVYDTITKNDGKTFSKNNIEKKLQELNLNYRFYYLLPNFTKPDVIFTQNYLPTENSTKLIYHISYLSESAVVFDELEALKQLTKDGRFAEFANSYVVEIGNLESKEPRFVSFNNSRKEEYRLITKIYESEVEKIPAIDIAKNHLEQIWKNTIKLRELGFNVIEQKEEDKIISKFINLETLDKVIAKQMLAGKVENAINIIKSWYNEIKSKLTSNEENGLHITEFGYLDLVFENAFFDNDKFIFFDQEWFLENIPIELILYRAIQNLYIYNREINSIYPFEKLLKDFELINYIETFEKIEKDFQEKIIDEKKIIENQESLDKLVDINSLSLLNDYKENNKKKEEVIKQIEEDNRKKQEYINVLESQIKILEKNQRKFFRRK